MVSSRPPTPAPRAAAPPVLVEGAFVPESAIEGWVRAGHAFRAGPILSMGDGRRFVLTDALRILGPRDGEGDPYGLTGRVEPLRELARQGAVVGRDGLRLGAVVYDAEFGAIPVIVGSADASGAHPKAG